MFPAQIIPFQLQTPVNTAGSAADTFLANIGAALAVLFLVAVATEILIEGARGVLSGVFRNAFNSPFFTRTTEFKAALASVQDLLPKDKDDQLLMVARLEAAHQMAKTLSEEKAKAVKVLVEKAVKATDAFDAKAAIHENLSEVIADVQWTERQRAVTLKVLAGTVGVLLCTPNDIDAFSFLAGSGDLGWIGPVLTGVAAAGGSTFWHDQIERVRTLRGVAQAAKQVIS